MRGPSECAGELISRERLLQIMQAMRGCRGLRGKIGWRFSLQQIVIFTAEKRNQFMAEGDEMDTLYLRQRLASRYGPIDSMYQ